MRFRETVCFCGCSNPSVRRGDLYLVSGQAILRRDNGRILASAAWNLLERASTEKWLAAHGGIIV